MIAMSIFLFVFGWLIKAVIHWLEGNIPNENTCSYFYALSSSSSRLNRLRPVIACKLVLLGGAGVGRNQGTEKTTPNPRGVCSQARPVTHHIIFSTSCMSYSHFFL